jgi:aminoglycoside phosphotransferase (APT) family kinase protein
VHTREPLGGTHVAQRLAEAGVIGGTDCQVREFAAGIDNRLYLVISTDGHELVVRSPKHGRRPRYAVAAWAAGLLDDRGIPAARPVWHDQRLSAETRCPGRALANTMPLRTAEDAALHAGTVLRSMHSIPVNGFGRLSPGGAGHHSTLLAWLMTTPSTSATFELSALNLDIATKLTDHAHLLPSTEPRLLHGDWTSRHVLAEGSQITGIVDLESVRGGDPLADIAGWSLQEAPVLTEALVAGYCSAPLSPQSLTALALYRLRIARSLLDLHMRHDDHDQAQLRARQLRADLDDLANENPRLVPRIAPTPLARRAQ